MDWKGLILPKSGFIFDPKEGKRIYFLAGPIRGGGDWQRDAINRLMKLDPNSYIVCPCRYQADHPLVWHAIGYNCAGSTEELYFESQTLWERHFLSKASVYGSVIFWLPIEDKNNPRPKENGPYAQDTYGELGRWSVRSARENAKVVVGAHPNFPGVSTIIKNLAADHHETGKIGSSELFPIYSTLDRVLEAGVSMAKK